MYRFPESLQAEIRLRLSHRLFELFSIFDGLNDACLRALACVFRAEFFPHQVHLLKEGDQVTRLYFIVSGSVDVMQGTQCTMCLGENFLGSNVLKRGRVQLSITEGTETTFTLRDEIDSTMYFFLILGLVGWLAVL